MVFLLYYNLSGTLVQQMYAQKDMQYSTISKNSGNVSEIEYSISCNEGE